MSLNIVLKKHIVALLAYSSLACFFPLMAEAQTPPDEKQEQAPKSESKIDYVFTEAPDDHVLGDENAPITMIVYASVTCSHCSNWFTNQWPVLKKELVGAGKIRFVLRALPTPPMQLSMAGFMIAECASAEDYFDVIQYQMENQSVFLEQAKIGKAREEYDKVARLAGLKDEDAVDACFADSTNLAHIHKSGARATASDLKGVPAFFINGDPYKGDQSADTLIKLISKMNEKSLSKLPNQK